MAIIGLRTTGNFAADERPKNWREGLLRLNPNGKAPLFALTAAMGKRTTDDPEYNWWEKPMQTRRLTLGADHLVGATTITVAAGAKAFKIGDLLRVEQSGEIIRVAADPSSDTALTVTRGFAGTTAAAIDYDGAGKNPYLLCIGSAYEEGSAAPSGIGFDPVKRYNYTQIFRNTLEATRTATKTRLRTVDQVKEAKRDAAETHSQDIERALFLGVRSESTLNGKPIRTTGGFYWTMQNFASQNVIDVSVTDASGIDMDRWEEILGLMFKYGSDQKMAFTGNRALAALNQMARRNTQYQLVQGQKELGMNVSKFISPFGELVVKTHPLFNQLGGGTTAGTAFLGMESDLAVFDMTNLKYVYITGDDMRYEPKQETPGLDGMKSGFITECGLEIGLPETHFLVQGLSKGKADD